ncbi:MAG: DPP IV N-terminal domain-containing protein, partial [Pirellulaceae bacterium]|nr:DPP IV N-terminal domain-containing protein [Pirellulaceae bacterium]
MATLNLLNSCVAGRKYQPSTRRQILARIAANRGVRWASLVMAVGFWGLGDHGCLAGSATQDDDGRPRVMSPNFRQAEQYSSTYLRQFVYSTSVTPSWIDKTDEFWYSYKTAAGTNYWRVHPENGTRLPLFDHVKLAGQLSVLSRQPIEPTQLALTRLEVSSQDDILKFVVDRVQYEYSLKTQELKKLAPATPTPAPESGRPAQGQREQQDQQQNQRQQDQQQQQQDQQQDQQHDQRQQEQQQDRQQEERRENEQQRERGQQQRGDRPGETANAPGANDAHRNFSPDRKSYVFAKGHNLYLVQVPEEPAPASEPPHADPPAAENEQIKEEVKLNQPVSEPSGSSPTAFWNLLQASAQESQTQTTQNPEKPADGETSPGPKVDPKWDKLAVQITTDGVDKYGFSGRSGRRGATQETKDDALSRPNVTWSKDSQKFYVSRSDLRGVQELWVINSLATPRPSLETYSYPMPGEEAVRKSELYWFQLGQTALQRIIPRWKDEFYSDVRFSETQDSLRFLRRDRLLRNVEYCALDLASKEIRPIFEEGFEKSTIAPKAIRFLKNNEEMIWWSERSGWGHFYLYDTQGQLKNSISAGTFFADRLVDLDEENRVMYFTAMGREPGENLNFSHLYSVRLDGGDLKLLNPGDANHSSILSPSKKFLVDNYSRVDLAPCSVLRNSNGVEVMKLEECDLSRLEQVGFRLPETFVVKASDGVTDLFGNMYKPFNFDPNKKYPI